MKYWLLVFFCITVGHAAPITLKESYEAARVNMETLRRNQNLLQQSIERKRQAMAVIFPTINAVGNETWIDKPDLRPGVSGAFTLLRQYSAGLRLMQPIFRGGLISGLETRQEEVLLAQYQKEASAVTLYQLVLSAYYNLYYAQLDLKNLHQLLRYSQDRVKELQGLTSVGRSRKAELIQAQTQLLDSEAQILTAERVVKASEQNFFFYTGLENFELASLNELPAELTSITEYMEKLKTRPDLKARAQEVIVAQNKVSVAKGGHYPSIDLVTNYYFDRTGILNTSKWDLGLLFTFPLFQGGLVSAQVREAVEGKKIAILNQEESNRIARRDLAVLYSNFFSMQSQVKKLSASLKKSEEAYKLTLKDYRNGLVNNLEVLQILNIFMTTKRALDNAATQSHLTYKNIEAAVGVLP